MCVCVCVCVNPELLKALALKDEVRRIQLRMVRLPTWILTFQFLPSFFTVHSTLLSPTFFKHKVVCIINDNSHPLTCNFINFVLHCLHITFVFDWTLNIKQVTFPCFRCNMSIWQWKTHFTSKHSEESHNIKNLLRNSYDRLAECNIYTPAVYCTQTPTALQQQTISDLVYCNNV